MGKLEDQITRHEGKRLDMYQDSEGIWTIGVGHNLEANGISEAVCGLMLKEDLSVARAEAMKFPWFHDLSEPRQAVVINMIFNMGRPTFMKFTKTIEYLRQKLYHSASKEMLNSKWAKQVGSRATELAEQMRTGAWDD